MGNIPERTEKSILGLHSMIMELDNKYDLSQKTIIEIGSWTGISAIEFQKHFKLVVCIDPWKATEGINTKFNMNVVEKIFDKRTENIKNIKKIKMTSEEAAAYFDYMTDSGQSTDNKFNFIYIDGCHTYKAVKQDLILWKDRIKNAICGHDYCSQFPGVVKAVDEIIGKPDLVFNDSSWIKYKKRCK